MVGTAAWHHRGPKNTRAKVFILQWLRFARSRRTKYHPANDSLTTIIEASLTKIKRLGRMRQSSESWQEHFPPLRSLDPMVKEYDDEAEGEARPLNCGKMPPPLFPFPGKRVILGTRAAAGREN